jgi:hypothetical protein
MALANSGAAAHKLGLQRTRDRGTVLLKPDVEAVEKVIFRKFAINKIKYLRVGK